MQLGKTLDYPAGFSHLKGSPLKTNCHMWNSYEELCIHVLLHRLSSSPNEQKSSSAEAVFTGVRLGSVSTDTGREEMNPLLPELPDLQTVMLMTWPYCILSHKVSQLVYYTEINYWVIKMSWIFTPDSMLRLYYLQLSLRHKTKKMNWKPAWITYYMELHIQYDGWFLILALANFVSSHKLFKVV